MRKLIRSRATKAFLTKDRAWTNDIKQAHNFVEHAEAQAAGTRLGSEEVELYYSFDDTRETPYDFGSSAL